MNEQSFIDVICQYPHEVYRRLIYADWLDDRGDPRGEFIRLQCNLAKCERCNGTGWRPNPAMERSFAPARVMCCRDKRSCEWRRRAASLLYEHCFPWADDAIGGSSWASKPESRRGLAVGDWCVRVGLEYGEAVATFRRGFVERVELSFTDWMTSGPAIVKLSPLMEVRLTDREPKSYRASGTRGMLGWFKQDLDHASWPDGETDVNDLWPHLHGANEVYADFASKDAACASLSRACLIWARKTAKLPELVEAT